MNRKKAQPVARQTETKTYVNRPPSWLVQLGQSLGKWPPLRGTSKQVFWAERLRRDRLAVARHRAPKLVDALVPIEDAVWWISTRDTPLDSLSWPRRDQVVRIFVVQLPQETTPS
jgi:hypothetical protein